MLVLPNLGPGSESNPQPLAQNAGSPTEPPDLPKKIHRLSQNKNADSLNT